MKVGSLFSGIGGFDLGCERAGMEVVWQVERDPFCQAVLKTRFPDAKRFGDIRECGANNLEAVDIITAGVPCQDVSVAGKRAGLGGERTGLFYDFARILRELRPAWFVFENVPGLLSSNRGRDFAEVLRVLMAECGYGIQWRVLDSRYFGVAQRRRRVYVVGSLGRPCPAEVLFEPEGGAGDIAASREAGQEVARALARGSVGSGYHYDPNGEDFVTAPIRKWRGGDSDGKADLVVANTLRESDGHHGRSSPRGDGCDNLIAAPLSSGSCDKSHAPGRRREDDINIVATLNSGGSKGGFRSEPGEHIVIQDVRGGTRDRTDSGQGIGIREGGPCYTLGATEQHAVAFESRYARNGRGAPASVVPLLKAESGQTGKGDAAPLVLIRSMSVRRLTPVEYERLQGFPDGWTIPDHSADDPEFPLLPKGFDSARYRALGNAVTVNVAAWIARRILPVVVA